MASGAFVAIAAPPPGLLVVAEPAAADELEAPAPAPPPELEELLGAAVVELDGVLGPVAVETAPDEVEAPVPEIMVDCVLNSNVRHPH